MYRSCACRCCRGVSSGIVLCDFAGDSVRLIVAWYVEINARGWCLKAVGATVTVVYFDALFCFADYAIVCSPMIIAMALLVWSPFRVADQIVFTPSLWCAAAGIQIALPFLCF